jgi:hypothetical protein
MDTLCDAAEDFEEFGNRKLSHVIAFCPENRGSSVYDLVEETLERQGVEDQTS